MDEYQDDWDHVIRTFLQRWADAEQEVEERASWEETNQESQEQELTTPRASTHTTDLTPEKGKLGEPSWRGTAWPRPSVLRSEWANKAKASNEGAQEAEDHVEPLKVDQDHGDESVDLRTEAARLQEEPKSEVAYETATKDNGKLPIVEKTQAEEMSIKVQNIEVATPMIMHVPKIVMQKRPEPARSAQNNCEAQVEAAHFVEKTNQMVADATVQQQVQNIEVAMPKFMHVPKTVMQERPKQERSAQNNCEAHVEELVHIVEKTTEVPRIQTEEMEYLGTDDQGVLFGYGYIIDETGLQTRDDWCQQLQHQLMAEAKAFEVELGRIVEKTSDVPRIQTEEKNINVTKVNQTAADATDQQQVQSIVVATPRIMHVPGIVAQERPKVERTVQNKGEAQLESVHIVEKEMSNQTVADETVQQQALNIAAATLNTSDQEIMLGYVSDENKGEAQRESVHIVEKTTKVPRIQTEEMSIKAPKVKQTVADATVQQQVQNIATATLNPSDQEIMLGYVSDETGTLG